MKSAKNEAFLHENYIKMPQNTISVKNPILLQIRTFPRIPHQKCCFFRLKFLKKFNFYIKSGWEKFNPFFWCGQKINDYKKMGDISIENY